MGSDEAALDEARRDQPEPATPPEDRDDWTTDSSSQAASSRPAPPEPDWEDRWRRAVADLDNARKRCARELDRVRADERARVASRWLSVLDNLELALSHARADPATIVSGVQAVRDEAVAVLNALGYPRRDESIYVGLPFDPAKHEVAVKTRISYVPDAVAFYPWMTVRDTLDYAASFRQRWSRETERALVLARRRGDHAGAELHAELDRRHADAARGAEDEERLAGFQRGAVDERVIGRRVRQQRRKKDLTQAAARLK